MPGTLKHTSTVSRITSKLSAVATTQSGGDHKLDELGCGENDFRWRCVILSAAADS